MNKYFFIYLLFANILLAQNIDSLLQELESNSEKSLYTIDEKLGHVSIYSQKELKLMQYTTLSDLLKELPLSNLNKNSFGISNLSVSGSKTDVSGFFRIFINNHEVSSNYTLSPSSSWMELPMNLVDYIEVYRGDSSFSLGSDSGIFFIRIYTKNPLKENGSEFFTAVTDKGSNSQSLSYSDTLENGWSYLAYVNRTKIKNFETYKNNKINNDSNQKHLYLNIKKNDTEINLGITQAKKDNYFGYSLDTDPDDGKVSSEDYFLDINTYFLRDKSIKVKLSYDVNKFKYEEQNAAPGIAVIPVLGFGSVKEFSQKNKIIKINLLASKSISFGNNNMLAGINYQKKKYSKADNYTVDFSDVKTDIGRFSDFDEEEMYSLFFQDDYKIDEKLSLVFNAKLDKYKRNGSLEDFKDEQFRVGAVYNINENFGLKTFYSKTYLTPSFYNIDYAINGSSNMKNQKYKVFTAEVVYAKDNSRFSVLYNNVKIKDFIYYTPIGFINIDHVIKVENFIFDYTYEIFQNNKINLNYFTTKLSEHINNSNKGGYVKFMGEYDSLEYFTSLIYRNSYEYLGVSVGNSYNFSLGATYNISKNLSLSLKGRNLFDDSTKSLYKEGGIGADFSLEDYQREITFSMKWVF
ncbi:MAG: TonB-dependent receptor plug domain-containing protein [Sulfurimonas sp.]|uniref:TonB-dependent receptor plug domain-containing protein n=1 Tax=Sulfurimonas sp. TaxID=2022749 RepID=UPI003D136AB6